MTQGLFGYQGLGAAQAGQFGQALGQLQQQQPQPQGLAAAYNFTPTTPQATTPAPPAGSQLVTPSNGTEPYYIEPNGQRFDANSLPTQIGNYQVGAAPQQTAQTAAQKWSLINDPNYNQYAQLSGVAQQYGQQGQNVLAQSAPGIQASLGTQQQLAGGPTSYQAAGLGGLQQTAAGQGPNVAGLASQQATGQALRAQLSAAANARGGAYAQAAAQQQAGQNAAQTEATAAGTAAQTAAQQQLAAQGQLATAANQQSALQTTAAQGLTSAQQAQQTAGLQYYEGQQQAAQTQAGLAAQLAQAQVANDYGLSGTQLTTSTQQNIANQQQNTQLAGAALGGTAALIGALASTGGAQAAALGARHAGASEELAAQIGAHVGQTIGRARVGPAVTAAEKPADTAAAREAAHTSPEHDAGMSVEEMHATLAQWRQAAARPVRASRPAPLPGPATEPLAPQAYALGGQLARAYGGSHAAG